MENKQSETCQTSQRMLLPTCAETTARERSFPSLASKKPPRRAEGSVKPTVVAMQVKSELKHYHTMFINF